jgi:hypothetical protein
MGMLSSWVGIFQPSALASNLQQAGAARSVPPAPAGQQAASRRLAGAQQAAGRPGFGPASAPLRPGCSPAPGGAPLDGVEELGGHHLKGLLLGAHPQQQLCGGKEVERPARAQVGCGGCRWVGWGAGVLGCWWVGWGRMQGEGVPGLHRRCRRARVCWAAAPAGPGRRCGAPRMATRWPSCAAAAPLPPAQPCPAPPLCCCPPVHPVAEAQKDEAVDAGHPQAPQHLLDLLACSGKVARQRSGGRVAVSKRSPAATASRLAQRQ